MALFRNSIKLLTTAQFLSRTSVKCQSRDIKRWVSPTLRELRRRKKLLGPEPEQFQNRSNFIEWNYNAELFAFAKRLNEEFDMKTLQRAFINRSYILKEEIRQRELGNENPQINLEDNRDLSEKGERLISDYVKAYLEYSLPRVPRSGLDVFYNYLTSDENLAHISANIGIKDLTLCSDFPVDTKSLVDTLKSVIGALYESSGEERAFIFIRDFICTQLNQKDLTEIWEIQKPFEMLKSICKEKNLEPPEPRLLGQCGKNTVLAAYHVGIYSKKKLIGSGYGESIAIAVDCAALDALRTFFGIEESMKPFDFNVTVERISKDKRKLLHNVK